MTRYWWPDDDYRTYGTGNAFYMFIAGRSRRVKKHPLGFGLQEKPKQRPPNKRAKK